MSGYLLDTHALLWWLDDDRRLPASLRRVIESARRVVVSDVSLWELAVKVSVGKFEASPDVLTWFERHLDAERFGELAISRRHIAHLARLPLHHRDPFDRLLVAQSRVDGLTLVTRDAAFDSYDVETIW